EDGIRDATVTGVQTCALPILALVVGVVLLVVGLAAAVSVDVVKDGYGIKSDEATYVSMALSAAYDYNLTYERRDLERFVGLYREIGRASCRERVDVLGWGVSG